MKDAFDEFYTDVVKIKRKMKTGTSPAGEAIYEYVVVNDSFRCDIQPGQAKLENTPSGTVVINSKELMAPATAEIYEKDIIVETVQRTAIDFMKVPAMPGPYTIRATKANFIEDQGAFDATDPANLVPLTLIIDGDPTAGEYKVSNTGLYTFSESDAGKKYAARYTYTFNEESIVQAFDRLKVIDHIEAKMTSFGGKA
jgi:hypothetical protein